ncbi:cupin domain-containing protein, partial [Anaerotruncus massiliensis (ex Liu et al. 2021)]|uniref:cupin domain-containing protein n=3 Tax=Oscillospiraceae TaxID=216572 RepID=UPI003AB1EFBE
TISVLWKIANGLKISFSALLERAEGGTSVVRAAEASPLLEDAGNYRNYPVFPFDETHPFELYRIEIEPGGHLEAAPHLPGTEESITVFSGDAAVSVDGTDYPLGPGDSIRFAADRPHGYRNAGTETVELSMVIFYGR